MLNIKFQTDEDILARIMISKSEISTSFANYLWDKYKSSYMLLQKDIKVHEIDNNIILELKQQNFFKTFFNEAKNNLKRIKKNWEKYKNKINLFLKGIFKKEFTLETTAIIVAPTLCCGINIGDNKFVWGHKNGLTDKNYDLVYLVHESLHSYFKNDDITHTIIEKISDLELAKFLNDSEKGYTGHSKLKELHIKILPFWNIYLNKTQEDIAKEKELYNINYALNNFIKYKSKINIMNIDDFIKFIKQINLEELLDIKCLYSIYIKK